MRSAGVTTRLTDNAVIDVAPKVFNGRVAWQQCRSWEKRMHKLPLRSAADREKHALKGSSSKG